nr:uncharacterized RNA-binding protein C1827.05C-like [Ipomoea batatas]
MHNYLLFEHVLQVHLVPPERVHPKLWNGVNRWYKPLDWVNIERKNHNKERTLEEHKKLVEGIKKRDRKRRKKIEAAGIDYECPEIVRTPQLFFFFFLSPMLQIMLISSQHKSMVRNIHE